MKNQTVLTEKSKLPLKLKNATKSNEGCGLALFYWGTKDQLFFKLASFHFSQQNVDFTEYEPFHFRRVRLAGGISDADYISAFETTIKERLSEVICHETAYNN